MNQTSSISPIANSIISGYLSLIAATGAQKDHDVLYLEYLLSVAQGQLSKGLIGCLQRDTTIHLGTKHGETNTKNRKGFVFDPSFVDVAVKSGDLASSPTSVVMYKPVHVVGHSYLVNDIFSDFSGTDNKGLACVCFTTRQIVSIALNNAKKLSHSNYFITICQNKVYLITVCERNGSMKFEACQLNISKLKCEPYDGSQFFLRSDPAQKVHSW